MVLFNAVMHCPSPVALSNQGRAESGSKRGDGAVQQGAPTCCACAAAANHLSLTVQVPTSLTLFPYLAYLTVALLLLACFGPRSPTSFRLFSVEEGVQAPGGPEVGRRDGI